MVVVFSTNEIHTTNTSIIYSTYWVNMYIHAVHVGAARRDHSVC